MNSKPVFSPRMRALNPALNAEDTNGLFQAFWLRRHYPRSGFDKVKRIRLAPGKQMPPENVGQMFIIFIIAVILILCSFAGLAFPVILALIGSNARRRWEGSYLPYRASRLFCETGYQADSGVDLWMTGVRGRDLIEAQFLESAELRKNSHWGALAVILCLYFYWLYRGHQPLTWFHPAAVGAFTLLIWRSADTHHLRHTEFLMHRARMLLTYWANPSLVSAFIISISGTMRLVLRGLVRFVLWFVPLMMLAGLFYWQRDALEWTGILPALRQQPVETGVLLVCTYSTITTTISAIMARKGIAGKVREVLDLADEPFSYFVARHIMKDADAGKWMEEVYGWDRGKAAP